MLLTLYVIILIYKATRLCCIIYVGVKMDSMVKIMPFFALSKRPACGETTLDHTMEDVGSNRSDVPILLGLITYRSTTPDQGKIPTIPTEHCFLLKAYCIKHITIIIFFIS